MINFIGTGNGKTDAGVEVAARLCNCDGRDLLAIISVEAAGSGFDSQHRLKMLFEPHIFYRLLHAAELDKDLNLATTMGIAYPVQGERPYPSDSYPRLQSACSINLELALQSASWGAPQILGENCHLCGYATAEAMVKDFLVGEDIQIGALARFLNRTGAGKYLAAHNWAAFAKVYNGKNFAKYHYDERIAKAYAGTPQMTFDPETSGVIVRNSAVVVDHQKKAALNSSGAALSGIAAGFLAIENFAHHFLSWPWAVGGVGILAFAGLYYFASASEHLVQGNAVAMNVKGTPS